jgi:hypothetical protein
MKVFVDECVTYDLMPHLAGHSFTHIADTPWRGKKNGELLCLVEADYEVFLTTDRHLPQQQNLKRFILAFIILRGRSNKVEDLSPLVPKLRAVLDRIAAAGIMPGDLHEITP